MQIWGVGILFFYSVRDICYKSIPTPHGSCTGRGNTCRVAKWNAITNEHIRSCKLIHGYRITFRCAASVSAFSMQKPSDLHYRTQLKVLWYRSVKREVSSIMSLLFAKNKSHDKNWRIASSRMLDTWRLTLPCKGILNRDLTTGRNEEQTHTLYQYLSIITFLSRIDFCSVLYSPSIYVLSMRRVSWVITHYYIYYRLLWVTNQIF